MNNSTTVPSKPILSPEFAELVRVSNLELVLCGGQRVGRYTHPKVWMLRDRHEHVQEEEKTRLTQKLAQFARENYLLKQENYKVKGITTHSS